MNRRSACTCAFAALSTAALTLSLGSAAFAETYGVPGIAEVGTNGSDAGNSDTYLTGIGVSHGGCARGALAVAIGDPERGCTNDPGQDAVGVVGVGLLGADSYGRAIAVSDSGTATGCSEPLWVDCITSIGVSALGSASGRDLTVTGVGRSDSELAAVSAAGDSTGIVAVSGTGSASPRSDGATLLSVSATGDAQGGFAVSGTGSANGPTAVSVLGTVEDLLP